VPAVRVHVQHVAGVDAAMTTPTNQAPGEPT
jgi:hypothetical protein